ncbi:NUDIX domain-containing protein (plasmid) [Aneurinibacillus sp. Ricciae_BoGa-3]|uniref:NUDIX hydrolase n=1 Tax=Aneurinibacillus sp. Ricciae_BoGa-3 TaxID=3022697 RepID=UPI00234165F9|nr:NUDIX domain-containing protein [Aneurinibacillus sp. Ricciae_BoGa-3]WCK57589.1 NUDIX domain-containing protein [Aneurinibacillus sp. Ricciae_BoGa-3]
MPNIKMVDGKPETLNERGQTEAEFLEWYKREEKDKYEKPSVTTDMLLFTVSDKKESNNRKVPDKELKVLLIKRKDHPYIGKWAIPGGFLNINEGLEATAIRELKEETNLDDVYLEQLYTWGDDVKRDPRMRVISTSYMALVDSTHLKVKAGDDAADAKWFSIERNILEESEEKKDGEVFITKKIDIQLTSEDGEERIVYTLLEKTHVQQRGIVKTRVVNYPAVIDTDNMAFDHIKILNYGLDRLQNKLEYTPIAFNLMPQYFTFIELQKVYEAILGRKLIVANFRRKIKPMVIETDIVREGSAHRPPKLFTFNVDWTLNSF